MSDKSAIEWTDATWNPIVGCSLVSPGCTNCYAMKMAARIENIDAKKRLQSYADHRHFDETHPQGRDPGRTKLLDPHTHYAGTTMPDKAVWTGKVALAPDHIILRPLHWKKPRRVFVNSMGDIFHEIVPDEWIDRVFAVMARASRHTFQVLTKRPKRMREYLSNQPATRRRWEDEIRKSGVETVSPPPILANVWLGVTAEDQRRADERIPDLLATPAAVRYVSCEPLLSQLEIDAYLYRLTERNGDGVDSPGLDWIIAGGESGSNARPSHPDWFRSLRDQCAAAGVPFFFKQWGEWKNGSDFAPDAMAILRDGRVIEPTQEAMKAVDKESAVPPQHPTMMRRVGKTRAGCLLDGREHNEFPRGSA